jgi:hypothetical protein
MDGGPRIVRVAVIAFAVTAAAIVMGLTSTGPPERTVGAQAAPTPVPFDQTAAIAKLRNQIKGRENEPAEKVFKNLQTPMLKGGPAARVLAVMEFGFARSLGVNCTHCHTPDKWEAEDKPQKQVARDMSAMVGRINGELLKGIKNLRNETPTIKLYDLSSRRSKASAESAPKGQLI